MIKEILYTYLGTNGILTTPIHLENIYSIKKFKLKANTGYDLTKDGINRKKSIIVPEEEVEQWYEIPIEGQN